MKQSLLSRTFGYLFTLGAITCLAALSGTQARAGQIGQVFVCYACQGTGNAAIDAALGANPGVASDGILFAFVNTSGAAITNGLFSDNASPADSFALPTIVAGGTFILIPGVTTGGGSHPSGGLFAPSGVMDTSEGAGGVSDATQFKFTGLQGASAVFSTTAGTSTGTAGTFTAGDPGLFHPFRDNSAAGTTSFLGLGPSGDGGCSNCYFGLVATLNTSATAVPEPGTYILASVALLLLGWRKRQ